MTYFEEMIKNKPPSRYLNAEIPNYLRLVANKKVTTLANTQVWQKVASLVYFQMCVQLTDEMEIFLV